jgi:hypothetical protein
MAIFVAHPEYACLGVLHFRIDLMFAYRFVRGVVSEHVLPMQVDVA